MRKHIILWVALGTIFLFSSTNVFAQAVLKFDLTATASNVSKSATTSGKGAADAVDTAVKAKEKLTFLDKIKKWYELQKARVQTIQTAVEAGEQAYGSATKVADSAKDLYESEKAKIEEEMNKATSGAGGDAARTAKEIEDLNIKLSDRKTVLLEENGAKAQAAQENYNTLKALLANETNDQARAQIEAQMSAAAQSMAEYEENRKQIEQEGDYLINDSEYKSLLNQKEVLESQFAELATQALKSLASQLASKLSAKTDEEIQQEYQQVLDDNFLKEDEDINDETTKRIMKHRREVLLQDILHAWYVGSQKLVLLPEKLEMADRLSSNILRVDLSSSATSLLIEMRIEELKNLFDYVELMLADMRLKTARNMLNQDFKLKDYSKNPAVINLDNYIFTEDDIVSDEGQKGFLDGVGPK